MIFLGKKAEVLNQFSDIVFKIDEHEYYKGDKQLQPVTHCVHSYQQPFLAEEISAKVASREGISPKMIQEKWLIKRDYAATLGSEFHLYVDMFLSYGNKLSCMFDQKSRLEQFHKFYDNIKGNFSLLATELMIYDEELGLAGTIDCLVQNSKGEVEIWDWKSNEAIDWENKYKKLLRPLNHLDDCKFNTYSLQLAIYREIIRCKTDFNMGRCYLIHFPPNRDYNVMATNPLTKELPLALKDIKDKA